MEQLGVKSAYAVFNVDQEAEVQKGIALASQLGSIDILINNAGIGNMGTLEDMSSEVWEQVIKTNLLVFIMRLKQSIHS